MRNYLRKLSSVPSGRVSGFWFFAVAVLLIGAVAHAMNKLDQAEADCIDAGGDFDWEITVNLIDFLQIKTTCDLPDGSEDNRTLNFYPTSIAPRENEDNVPGA